MAGELICRCRKRFASGFALNADWKTPLAMSDGAAAITVLFGPSGSGKTTLLRLIAGLEAPDSGSIFFRGSEWFGERTLTPQQRRAGFVFQDYALFPHLTAQQNVLFGAQEPKRAEAFLSSFGLDDLRGRYPRQLSGGQQQRVALARALAADPALLLLDEPLSALDALTRARTRQELRRTLEESGVPSIIVTHDRSEAIALGDWIGVIIDGEIRQTGPIREVFRRPSDPRVAESLGVENIIPAQVVAREAGLVTVAAGTVLLECVDIGETGGVLACFRGEDVILTHAAGRESSARNRIEGVVRSILPEGAVARVEIDCGVPVVALVTAQSAAELDLREGQPIAAVVKATSIHLLK